MDRLKAVELQPGESGWLKSARLIFFALALLQLLAANASPAWKSISITALLLAFVLILRRTNKLTRFQMLRLQRNGLVTLVQRDGQEIPGVLEGESWTSAWVSVLPVGCFDRWPRQQILVCRSKNHPDDYRHMLAFLRLGTAADGADTNLINAIRKANSRSRE